MKTFDSIKKDIVFEEKTKGIRSQKVLDFLKMLGSNDYYVHFSSRNDKPVFTIKDQDGDYTRGYNDTPAAFYAWQLNSYKKEIKNKIKKIIEDAKKEIGETEDLGILGDIIDGGAASASRKYMEKRGVSIRKAMNSLYGSERNNAIFVRAKPGLKWLRVREMRGGERAILLKSTLNHRIFKPLNYNYITPEDIVEAFESIIETNKIKEAEDYLLNVYSKKKKKELEKKEREAIYNLVYSMQGSLTSYYRSNAYKVNDQRSKESIAVYILFREYIISNHGPEKTTKIFTSMGFDAFRDDTYAQGFGQGNRGVVYEGEPAQVGFMSLKALKHVSTMNKSEMVVYPEDFDLILKILK